VGRLGNEDAFGGRGWWHDQRILAATGEGIEKEEPRAWEGWWNEQIVRCQLWAVGWKLTEYRLNL